MGTGNLMGMLFGSWTLGGIAIGVMSLMFIAWVGTRIIDEKHSGLVIKRFGKPLPEGRIIATDGEAGYQARMLSPGWHFGWWRWRYKIFKVPVLIVGPGEIALVVAADGKPIPSERVLGKEVACDNCQDAAAFLRNGGERGRQIAVLTAGTYRINPALFDVVLPSNANGHGVSANDLHVYHMPADKVGIITVLDGRPITAGDLAGPIVHGHESFQRGQQFVNAGGCRGLQEEVLLSGNWNLNPWFVRVDQVPLTEIPIGYVGVVVSYVGGEHLDVSGDEFSHGDLVEKGRKGVWVEPLLPGKHPINTRVMKVELVPTTNIVLNWAAQTESHQYDARLSSISVRSRDGFSFSLDVSQIIHIGMKNAPRVISRVGSMQNLVDHVLQPTVGNYFRNSAQQVTVLDFLSARTERQKEAFDNIKKAIEAYDVECIDTLIGDIVPPAELMKTQTDRKIAAELERTYDAQREAQIKRQALERETAVANIQSEIVRAEQMVQISERNAVAMEASAKGEAAAIKLRAEGQAAGVRANGEAQAFTTRANGDAQASSTRAIGAAKAEAYRLGIEALGSIGYTSLQIAQVLGENKVKLVPDIAVGGGGDGSMRLADVLVGRMLANQLPADHNGSGSATSTPADK
jgi:uncharacterized membrane protein YqiK